MELVAPSTSKPKALVIANACDLLDPAERGLRVDREIAALEGLGFRAEELDLRRHFAAQTGKGRPAGESVPGSPSILTSELASASLVWARGGNAFVLLRAMRQSGFAGLLTQGLASDSVVYGGYSGGIAVLPQTLRGLETVNDPAAVPPGYDPAVPWDGLGVLPYSLAPHYRSAHAASPGIDGVVGYFQAHGMPFKTLKDGEVWVVSGTREELVS
jgi:dipeptidase E